MEIFQIPRIFRFITHLFLVNKKSIEIQSFIVQLQSIQISHESKIHPNLQ